MSYILRGLIPDGGGMYFLPRRVGLARAKELIFTGRRVAPDEALRARHGRPRDGAGRRCWPTPRPGPPSWPAARRPRSALAKSILDQTFEMTVEDMFALGARPRRSATRPREHRASVAAFLETVERGKAARSSETSR